MVTRTVPVRINLRTIAKAAGVGVATASRALRGLADVSPETRRRVEAAAQRHGYVRDPQLSSALAFARRPEKSVYRETFAFLGAVTESEHDQILWLRDAYRGFCSRATALGYAVHYIATPRSKQAQRILSRQLHSQGVRGLAISSLAAWSPFSMEMAWEKFVAIVLGRALWKPNLPRVDREIVDDFSDMLDEVRRRGYQRIGLAMNLSDEIRRRWNMLAMYLLFQHRNPDLPALAPLEEQADREYSHQSLLRWMEKEKPDVIIVNGPEPYDWLCKAGWRVPDEIAICRIDSVPGRPETGLAADYEQMGRTLVNLLSGALERGEFGLPERPSVQNIGNIWQEGTTLPAITRSLKK